MRFKKYIPLLIYLLLILGCLLIVRLTGKLAEPGEPEETSSAWETVRPVPEEPSEPEDDLERETEAESGPLVPESEPECREARQEWQEEAEELPEEPYCPPTLMLASDLHYISQNTHDDGTAFREMVARDDGKISEYSDVLLDTLVEEAIAGKPSALVLTGDITLNGERENHRDLAEKLRRVTEAGVAVLVVPGNHDIKNGNAATYFEGARKPAQYLEDAEDFYEIYHEFGYDQAFSRDEASLSYFYALDDLHWMLMLDTCQYEDYNHVNGRLKPETMEWLESGLKQAQEQGIAVVPAGHHNLLSESRLYTTECTMENHLDIIRIFEEYRLPLYISGHLHAQRIKKHKREPGVSDGAYGIEEIVLPPYSIPPCQYGWLKWQTDGGMAFETRKADVGAYARRQKLKDEKLLQFGEYGQEYVKGILRNQVRTSFHAIPEDLKDEMADLYALLYYDYCAGNRMRRDEVNDSRACRLWDRLAPDSRYVKEMNQMMEDVRQAQHDWSR